LVYTRRSVLFFFARGITFYKQVALTIRVKLQRVVNAVRRSVCRRISSRNVAIDTETWLFLMNN